MYRRINPSSAQELPMRMLYQPLGGGVFHRACEADGFRGLAAALVDDPRYETSDVESRLVERLRLADEVALLARLEERELSISDHDAPLTINVASDEAFIRSLERLGFASVNPTLIQPMHDGAPPEVWK